MQNKHTSVLKRFGTFLMSGFNLFAKAFPSQALPNAYEKMAEYGKLCYLCYKTFQQD